MERIGETLKSQKRKYFKKPRYTVVIHDVREHLGLSANTYIVMDSIHKLSRSDPDYPWCRMSKDNISKFLGLGRRTVFYAITTGLEKKLIEKNEKGNLRTTKKWVDIVELYELKQKKYT